jgi:hypothetical protein
LVFKFGFFSMSSNQTVTRLGYAGLCPFVLLTGLMWLGDSKLLPSVSISLIGYAAAIVSFLGGVHWGIGFMKGPAAPSYHFIWGVMPSLVAWLALMMPAYAALPLLGLALVACYIFDRRTYPAAGLESWLPMRLRLTVVATLSCLLGAAVG